MPFPCLPIINAVKTEKAVQRERVIILNWLVIKWYLKTELFQDVRVAYVTNLYQLYCSTCKVIPELFQYKQSM